MKKLTLKFGFCALAAVIVMSFPGCSFDTMHNLLEREKTEPEKRKELTEEEKYKFLRKDEEPAQKKSHQSMKEDEVREQTDKKNIVDPKKCADAAKPVSTATAPKKKTAQEPFYENFVVLDGDEEVSVSLVFNSAPILDVIPAFADALGFNFAADADLKGTVTLNLNTKMTKRELWNAFDRLLSISGAGAVVDNSLIRIMPVSKLARRPDLYTVPDENSEVIYYQLRYATAKDAVNQLKQFVTKDGTCVELSRPNAVIVCDTKEALPKLRQILELLDKNGKSKWPRAIFRCTNILPSKIVTELTAIMPILGFTVYQTTDKTELPGSIRMTGIDRLQLLTVSAATNEAIEEVRKWVEILDGADSLDQERVFVYKVMSGKADQLMQALAVIYNTTGTSLTIDTNTGNNRTQTVNSQNNNRNSTSNSNNRNNNNLNTTSTKTDQSSSIFETPVKIFSDGTLNRLVIRTTPRTYASIKALLDRLDVVPAQVLLQVLVVEVTLTEATKFGLEFSGTGKINGNNVTFGQHYSNLNANPTKSENISKPEGFSFMISDPDDPSSSFGHIQALAGNNMIKVVSSPQILVSSHTEAVITVGKKIPYTSSALTDTASTSALGTTYNTQVKYQDTGITLTITPIVTSTNMISIDVTQELSSAQQNTLTKVDAPEFPTRKIQTEMTIPNGRTMVIGGLIQEQKSDVLNTLPIINDIPMLRRAFGSTDASVERTEILVMITGYIVDEKSRTEEMIKRYNDAIRALGDFDSKLGDRPGATSRVQLLDEKDVGVIGRK